MKIFNISIIIFSIVTGIILYIFSEKDRENLKKYGILTDCKITVIRVGYIDYTYVVDDSLYVDDSMKPYPSIQLGEIFKVRYNPNSLTSKTNIILTKPVIVDSLFDTTYSLSCDFILFKDKKVKFTYQIENKEYERMQFFPDKIEIDKNKKYLVKYRKDNPKIGYIFLDKWEE